MDYTLSVFLLTLLWSESESSSTMSNSLRPHGQYSPWNSPGQNTGVVSCSLLQGIFPTQGSNRGLPHCGWIIYYLSHQGSPRILEWIAYPFSGGSSRPRDRTKVSCIGGRFFTSWATREVCEWSSWYFIVLSHIFPWRRKWQVTPVFLPGGFYGQRSLVGYNLWDRTQLSDWEHPIY